MNFGLGMKLEYSNRIKVDKASNDEIGYIHLYTMGSANISQFISFIQLLTKGLIIDVGTIGEYSIVLFCQN